MALPNVSSKGLDEAETIAKRADVYRTAAKLIAQAGLSSDADHEDVLRLARYLVGEES